MNAIPCDNEDGCIEEAIGLHEIFLHNGTSRLVNRCEEHAPLSGRYVGEPEDRSTEALLNSILGVNAAPCANCGLTPDHKFHQPCRYKCGTPDGPDTPGRRAYGCPCHAYAPMVEVSR